MNHPFDENFESIRALAGETQRLAGLALQSNTCRYYYDIDPNATTSFVHTFRDMWDSENAKD